VKPNLDHETRKKVKFVYSSDKESQRIMTEVFDMDQLDLAFGSNNPAGFCSFVGHVMTNEAYPKKFDLHNVTM
jgi:hypothetical protein